MIPYPYRFETLPALDLTGFTRFVESGGEMFDAVRSDGRWEVLRSLGGGGQTIYGIASMDGQCPAGKYRYTVAVRTPEAFPDTTGQRDGVFRHCIPAAEWAVFTLHSFVEQYGKFWQDDPYKLVRALGREFDGTIGLHIDVYAPSFVADTDGMEFWMPVKQEG